MGRLVLAAKSAARKYVALQAKPTNDPVQVAGQPCQVIKSFYGLLGALCVLAGQLLDLAGGLRDFGGGGGLFRGGCRDELNLGFHPL